jgi:hypothetical protein
MRVMTVDTPKYDRKITVRDTMIAIGIAFWGFLTSSPVYGQKNYRFKQLS